MGAKVGKNWMLDAGVLILDAGFRMLGAGSLYFKMAS